MAYKFNGGRGAMICDKCNIIIKEGVFPSKLSKKYQFCIECKQKRLVRLKRNKGKRNG